MANRYSSLSLREVVSLCADPRNDDAWEEFVSRVDKPIALTIKRTAEVCGERSLSLIEDLRQETYDKLLKGGCRHLRDFATEHADDEILRYIKRTAINVTYDHFKHVRSQKEGGHNPHVSTSDIDIEAGKQAPRSQERITFELFLKEIDEHLKHCLNGSDRERDRMIFWLYFRQGMSTREIASLPSIVGLTAKGVGSVIERLKDGIRERILRSRVDSEDDEG
ncbi:MAG TPA: sigma-70 family RNA polymerase sigma factor [Candidatus Acidoferrum sp.]|nr:sigma-70 family RNA polymerase sigma factor [Candidatus Acidoferrum sp.]